MLSLFFKPLQNPHHSLSILHISLLCSKQLEATMERKRSHASLTMLAMLLGLLSQSLVIPVMSITVEDQKNYYTPDPHAGNPPSGFSDSLCNPLTKVYLH